MKKRFLHGSNSLGFMLADYFCFRPHERGRYFTAQQAVAAFSSMTTSRCLPSSTTMWASHKFVNFIANVDFPLLAVWTVATKADPLAASANVATVKREMSRLLILARETTATVVPIS
jgi:hypothetical protein